MEEKKKIQPRGGAPVTVTVPGSKSFTHRMLICAALAGGRSVIANGLVSEDTGLTAKGLSAMGAEISHEDGAYVVEGTGGELSPSPDPIFLNNSGTSIRLLTSVAAIGKGAYTLTGSPRMEKRPIGDLVDALERLGVSIRAMSEGRCPPVLVQGKAIKKIQTEVDCRVSSQYLSGLLLIGPYTRHGLEITVSHGPVSRPYLDMTVSVMEKFGARVDRRGYEWFRVLPDHPYKAGNYRVETDASNASYFFAAGMIAKTPVTVAGIRRDSVQGDVRLLDVFEKMGAKVAESAGGISVTAGDLSAVSVDLGDMPDMVPTLAVVAAFARGVTRIQNVAHLAAKESDRLTAVVTELNRMGIEARHDGTDMFVQGGEPRGAEIATYNDHRMAMAFAVAGLAVPGVVVKDPGCVEKSFPEFWDVFQNLY